METIAIRQPKEMMPGMDNQAATLRAAAGGDPVAAGKLVEATYQEVWGTLYRLTSGDPDLAADLAQDTYRKAWQARPRFQGKAQFSTWIYRIAYNTFLNHIRRPRPVIPLEPEMTERLPAGGPDPVAVLAESEEAGELRDAVLTLPDDLRFTVTAHYWQGLPVREIALLEEVSPAAIRKRLRKAHRVLRLSIEEVS
jgi:RNA polymerase sigma-70 factor (ECF subfamily)